MSEIKSNPKSIYKSFEQLKAEIFPSLVEEENKKEQMRDIKDLGISLANQVFEKNIIKYSV